jgi:hypothetical protein
MQQTTVNPPATRGGQRRIATVQQKRLDVPAAEKAAAKVGSARDITARAKVELKAVLQDINDEDMRGKEERAEVATHATATRDLPIGKENRSAPRSIQQKSKPRAAARGAKGKNPLPTQKAMVQKQPAELEGDTLSEAESHDDEPVPMQPRGSRRKRGRSACTYVTAGHIHTPPAKKVQLCLPAWYLLSVGTIFHTDIYPVEKLSKKDEA